eukprot:TRINITY_DN1511_c0_g1_i10.p1 TRINITY_DN1511_c0_g1~~TRINITY_DN1511_c0_g1_i10.p1  ORF type:complete len:191 (+),score=28.64 TRINITY_DN1511_c0_g1_i10:649-1221(+)
MTIVKDMLRDTEVAVCSFMMLRPRFLHPNVASASNTTASTQISGTGIVPSTTTQPMSSSIVPVFEFYSGLPRRPSPFLQNTVTRFEKYLGECKQWIEELEQLLLSDTDDRSSNSDMSLLHSLPKVMSNVHDYFFHVAAKERVASLYEDNPSIAKKDLDHDAVALVCLHPVSEDPNRLAYCFWILYGCMCF